MSKMQFTAWRCLEMLGASPSGPVFSRAKYNPENPRNKSSTEERKLENCQMRVRKFYDQPQNQSH
jgi:hypothetical protein